MSFMKSDCLFPHLPFHSRRQPISNPAIEVLASDQLEKVHGGATLLGGGDGYCGTPYPVNFPFPRPIYVSVLELRSQLVRR
jgi:hypothetical protein